MAGRIKIVVLGTRGFPNVQGGVEKHCEELYPRLVKLGCDVTVLVRSPYVPKEEKIKVWKGVKFEYIWCPRKKSLEAIIHSFLGVFKAKNIKPDILHIHSIGPSLVTPIAKKLGLKIVMTHHGPDYYRKKWGNIAKTVLKLGEYFGINFSDKIIVISKWVKELIQRKYKKNSVFIPNGVSIQNPCPPGEILKKFKLKKGSYVFTACRFVPEKGILDLIKAYRRLNNPPFKLVIAGDADHEDEYSKKVKYEASKSKNIILTGFISGESLRELYSNAALFILPSYYEGLPIALLEALSYGLPVLVSDIPAHREIPLKDFRYFKVGNIDELSDKLLKLYYLGIDKKERDSILRLLQNIYNWDIVAEKVLKVYRDIL